MSIEFPRVSTSDDTTYSGFEADLETPVATALVAQAGSGIPQGASTPDLPSELTVDPDGTVRLPAGVMLGTFRVDGANLVLVQADGTEIVITDGALRVPAFVIGGIEIPQEVLIAALDASGIDVAAGPDGTFSATGGGPQESHARFEPLPENDQDSDGPDFTDLLGDTSFAGEGSGADNDQASGEPNVAPVVTSGPHLGAMVESADNPGGVDADPATASGTIVFNDFNATDAHTATVSAREIVGFSGAGTLTPAQIQAFLDGFALTQVNQQAGGAPGSVAWQYALGNDALDFLAVGEMATLEFTIEIGDGQVSVPATVRVVITGTNDAPRIEAGASYEYTEAAGTDNDPDAVRAQSSGLLAFEDVDLSDGHDVSYQIGQISWKDEDGNDVAGHDLPDGLTAALLSAFGAQVQGASTGTGSGSISWTFGAADRLFDFLGEDETLAIAYELTVDDGNGGTHTETVTVTITGANDQPMAVPDEKDLSVSEVQQTFEPGNSPVSIDVLANDVDADATDVLYVSRWEGFSSNGIPHFHLMQAAGDSEVLRFLLTMPTGKARVILTKTGELQLFVIEGEPFAALGGDTSFTIRTSYFVSDGTSESRVQSVFIIHPDSGANPPAEADVKESGYVLDENGDEVAEPGIHETSGSFYSYADPSSLTITYEQEDGDYGTFELNELTGVWTYVLDNSRPATQALKDGETVEQRLRVKVEADGLDDEIYEVIVRIEGTNDAPTITASTPSAELVEPGIGPDGGPVAGTLVSVVTLTRDDVDAEDIPLYDAAALTDAGWQQAGSTWTLDLAYGTVTLDTDGDTLTYTLDPGKANRLAADEVELEQVEIPVIDGTGVTASTVVTFTITGTNDAPSVTGGDTAGAATEDTDYGTAPAASGQLTAADADNGAVLTWTVSGPSDFGEMRIDPQTGEWAFHLDNGLPSVQALARGQSVQQVFTATVTDEHGESDTRDITITIHGANDAPVVQGEAVEIEEFSDTTLSPARNGTSGMLDYADIDLADTHSVTVLSVRAQGDTGPILGNPFAQFLALRPLLSLGDAERLAGSENGTIAWSFSAPDAFFDYLGADEALDIVYTIRIADGRGGAHQSTLTITVKGTNDQPVFLNGPVVELDEIDSQAASGVLVFADADINDTYDAEVSTPEIAVSNGTVPDGLAASLNFSLGTPQTTAGAPGGLLPWSFAAPDGAFDFLADGETLTLTYTVKIQDDSGAANDADTTTVTIVITGTNDAPIITSGNQSATIIEPGDLAFIDEAGPSSPSQIGSTRLPGLEPTVDVDPLLDTHVVAGMTVAQMNAAIAAVKDALGAGATDADAIAAVWEYLDERYSYENALINEASAKLAIVYAQYLKTGGMALLDVVAKYSPDSADPESLPDRVQSLHDNILGNLNWYGLSDKLGAASEAYLRIEAEAADAGLSALFNDRPVHGGYEGETNDSLAWDIANGFYPAASGTMTATDADTDISELEWSDITGAPGTYGTFSIDAATGAWTYVLNPGAADPLKAGEPATETFTVQVDDGKGGTNTATVTITITGSNDAPVITSNESFAHPASGLTGFVGADEAADGKFEPEQDFESFISSRMVSGMNMAEVLDAVRAELGAEATQAQAIAHVWDHIDDNGGYYNNLLNEASARLAVEYAKYLLGGNAPLLDVVAKYAPDSNGDGIPQRLQSLHDNLLGNAHGPSLIDKMLGAGEGSNEAPIPDVYAAILDLLAQEGLSHLLDRPIYDGNQGSTNDALAWDAAHGLVPAAAGKLVATDIDGDDLTWSLPDHPGGSVTGTYGTFSINAAGEWQYIADTASNAFKALAHGETATETFVARVSDGNGGIDTTEVTVTVTGANDAPVITGGIAGAVTESGDLALIDEAGPGGRLTHGYDLDVTADDALAAIKAGDKTAGAFDAAFAAIEAITGSKAATFAVFWEYLDANYNPYFTDNDPINVATARLGIAYALHLENGGASLIDVIAKFVADVNGNGTPDRMQSLHDNLLGNASGSVLNTRFDGALLAELQDTAPDYLIARQWVSGKESEAGVAAAMHAGDMANGYAPSKTGQLTASDADNGASLTFAVDDGTGTFTGSSTGIYGTLTVDADGKWTYVLNDNDPDTQALAQGASAEDIFTVQVKDKHGATGTETLTVTITGANDAPVVTGSWDGIAGADMNGGNLEPSSAILAGLTVDLSALIADGAGLPLLFAQVVADLGGDKAQAIAVIWDYLDDNYVRSGPGHLDVNKAFTLLGIEYARYLKVESGVPLAGLVAKFTADDGDANTTPERFQTLHDNLLGNITNAALLQRYLNSSNPDSVYDQPLYDALKAAITGIDPELLDRPYYDGGEGKLNPAFAWDIDHGYLTATTTGKLSATDIDGDTLNWSGNADGAYGRFEIDPTTGTWTYTVDPSRTGDLAAGEVALETFTVTVSDGKGGTDTAEITVSVTGANTNEAPAIVSSSGPGSIIEDFSYSVARGELVSNGTFGNTELLDWDIASPGATYGVSGGRLNITTDAGGAPFEISQNLATSAGVKYTISFQVNGTGANALEVVWNGQTVAALTDINGTHTYTFEVIGEAYSSTLALVMTNGGWWIDNVSVLTDLPWGMEETAGTVAFTDADIDDTHDVSWTPRETSGYFGTFQAEIESSGGSGVVNWTFTVPDADIQHLRAGQYVDQVYTVRIEDEAGATASQDVTVRIYGRNDGPTAIALSALTVDENDAGAVIGTLTTTDVDTGDTHTYTVDDDRFEIVGGQLKLKDGQSLDFESEPSVTVNVTSEDEAGISTDQQFTITVNDINEAPTSLTVTPQSVTEGVAGALVASFVLEDPDTSGSPFATYDYEIIGEGADRFTYSGGQIRLKSGQALSEDVSGLTLRATNRDDPSHVIEQDFSITVTENEAPTDIVFMGNRGLSAANVSTQTDIPAGTMLFSMLGQDPNGGTLTYRFGNNSTGTLVTTTGNGGATRTFHLYGDSVGNYGSDSPDGFSYPDHNPSSPPYNFLFETKVRDAAGLTYTEQVVLWLGRTPQTSSATSDTIAPTGTVNGTSYDYRNIEQVIYGFGGKDTITGGNKSDWIAGGEGNDTLTGGGGADRFVWTTEAVTDTNADTITDYSYAQGDRIDLQSIVSRIINGGVEGYVQLRISGDDVKVFVDTNGGGNNWRIVYTLRNYARDLASGDKSVGFFFADQDWTITIADGGGLTYSTSVDPIILDLDGNGFAFNATAAFDLDGDGTRDRVAWNSSGDGILAIDLNGNGVIDDGTEMFTPWFGGGGFANGGEALASLDANGDGMIDIDDPTFANLVIWRDENADGITDPDELSSLADNGITAISAPAQAVNGVVDGQEVIGEGSFTREDGSTGSYIEVALETVFGRTVTGTDGDDVLAGGAAGDILIGREGADIFIIDRPALAGLEIADLIADYDFDEGDRIDLSSLLGGDADAAIGKSFDAASGETLLSIGGNDAVRLAGDYSTVDVGILFMDQDGQQAVAII